MSKKEYTENLEFLLKSKLGRIDGTNFRTHFATRLPQTSPPKHQLRSPFAWG
ncbi:hypothetical protein LEP1GSC036_0154 [Leptospira weilii str. 2006001853]|uniref:Uncharacterized protein n=1 Tax=Leptospira weilii str. 2006001853 TaxID=1001589 RepID=A0A828YZ42_9LEPT|nr:hypothetical protein LEP1GSC036_0154 [Leptospira weilii str. 2006001853]